jgi:hypothetical protein
MDKLLPENQQQQTEPLDEDAGVGMDGWESEPQTIDAETLVNRRSSPRKRAFQLGLALLLLVIVLALFRSVIVPSHTPNTDLPNLPNGSQLVAISANVSYGTVTIDGKPLSGGPPYIFRPVFGGSDTVTYSAPPFLSETCHVSWDRDGGFDGPNSGEPCINSSTGAASVTPFAHQKAVISNVLYFQFGESALPANLKALAETLVRQIVVPASGRITIPAGEYYGAGQDDKGQIISRIATTPLTETALLQIPGPGLLSPSLPCQDVICPQDPSVFDQSQLAPSPGNAWNIVIPLIFQWQIQTQDGQIIEAYTDHAGASVSLSLGLDESGNWQLIQPNSLSSLHEDERVQFSQTVCSDGTNALSGALQDHQAYSQDIAIEPDTSDLGLNGCVIRIVKFNNSTNSTSLIGTAIWRFGVLLAADATTHNLYPWLPLAPQSEVDAVTNVTAAAS